MRQKAKLAQAFAHGPDLLILDEPFSGLDPVGRRLIKQFLLQWIGDGKGLIIASHILHDVESITQSFLLICNGRLLAAGSAEEIHSLLADVPNEIYIRCSNAIRLAQTMLRTKVVESVRLNDREEESGRRNAEPGGPLPAATRMDAGSECSDPRASLF